MAGQREGRADEATAAALFLVSDQSSYTTGAEPFVDGGLAQVWAGRTGNPSRPAVW